MTQENRKEHWLTVRHPALEDLKRLFQGKWASQKKESGTTEFDLKFEHTHKLNDKEAIELEFHRSDPHDQQRVDCRFVRHGQRIFGFTIDENGLEYLGLHDQNVEFSFNGSDKIGLEKGISIQYPEPYAPHGVLRDDLPKFYDLAGKVVEWVQKVIKDGNIGEIPFNIGPVQENQLQEVPEITAVAN